MGIIIGKFRKKPSTYDVLMKLENEILSIEEFQKRTKQTQRKIVFRFVLLAILIYVLLAFLLYLYFSQISQNQKLIWSIPLISVAFPLIIWLIKKFLTWYYNRKIGKNEKRLITLKEKKKEILEKVMETETYKVAKQILDKFGNESKKSVVLSTPIVEKSSSLVKASANPYESGLRLRVNAQQNLMRGRISFGGPADTPRSLQPQLSLPTPGTKRSINVLPTPGQLAITPTPTALPRSILPRDRSVLDKMVDYLVGDGPSNRYALICQKCSSHNGMALKEEFEYLSFRCGYCSHFNPARKKKPVGPKFDSPLTPVKMISRSESSDSDKNSENDSESETRPIVEEPRSDSPDIGTSESERISDTELLADESKMEVDDHGSREDNTKITNLTESGDAAHTTEDVSDK